MNSPLTNSFISPTFTRPDFSFLNEKPSGGGPDSETGQVAGSGGNLINFGQTGSSGTSMESLMGDASDGTDSSQKNELPQSVMQLVTQILQAFEQFLQSQQGNSSGGGGTGGGNSSSPLSSAFSQQPDAGEALAGAEEGNTPAAAEPAPATAQQATSPEIPELTPEQTQSASPETAAAPQNGTSHSVSNSKGSDLHLPDALKDYEGDIQNAALNTGVPANVLAAQIWQESRGNLGAATVNGGNGGKDAGLMQVNDTTFADLKSKNPDLLGPNASQTNQRDNIMAGALYMRDQLNNFNGSMDAALRAYNSGPQNVNLNDFSDISKTGTGDATYVDKVNDFANIIATGKGTLPA